MLSIALAPWRGSPVLLRNADAVHESASTMKVAVLAAVYRSGIDLDLPVPVRNGFRSAVGGEYANSRGYDGDPRPWELLGTSVPLRWLAERMITHSSNLATNLCLAQVGLPAVAEVWRRAGATASVTPRGIEDTRAGAAGLLNQVTARDLVRLLESLDAAELAVLEGNAHRVDLAAGLPPGTRTAFKNGWFPGVRHCVALIHPQDAAPYTLAVCYTGPLASGRTVGDPAAGLLARISAGVWERRGELTR
ncbi:serine hydrolase [Kitasatospora sp. NBC_01266]|uniref:serine hydrolase n=1 Tax=Kitasatospora sp. NBC_01266 TaxID=2903572 RepID=UPI002E3508B1|nr:serine hydrolase [Kitasatospora sp. NBC_01266]